jgi:hypothetical protein
LADYNQYYKHRGIIVNTDFITHIRQTNILVYAHAFNKNGAYSIKTDVFLEHKGYHEESENITEVKGSL